MFGQQPFDAGPHLGHRIFDGLIARLAGRWPRSSFSAASAKTAQRFPDDMRQGRGNDLRLVMPDAATGCRDRTGDRFRRPRRVDRLRRAQRPNGGGRIGNRRIDQRRQQDPHQILDQPDREPAGRSGRQPLNPDAAISRGIGDQRQRRRSSPAARAASGASSSSSAKRQPVQPDAGLSPSSRIGVSTTTRRASRRPCRSAAARSSPRHGLRRPWAAKRCPPVGGVPGTGRRKDSGRGAAR